AADLFIDCSGEAALLIGKALEVKFIDWSQFLPASRSIAVTAKTDHHNIPVHHCTATDDGWFLSTPLQHRTACQFRYSPEHVSDELAATHIERFVSELGPEALVLSNMRSGHRQYMWHKNCVALGGAAGWVEPLDISNFDFLMSGLSRLTSLMPTLAMQDSLATLFNREMTEQLACVRDFGLLHYYAAQWRDTPFWNATREHEKPDSLQQRIELFASSSRICLEEHETFGRDTWAAAFLAAGITPRAYDPLLDLVNDEQIQQYFSNMRRAIQEAVRQMPNHREYLAQLRH
ncbi:MAG: tryptophan 7-halogenase, partial [Chromatiales bacterium]|nr:tryptophan 7-halogenase [Chromatiales bacterium]